MRTISVRDISTTARVATWPPIAKDRDSVGNERQLLKPVRNEEDRGSVVAKVAHDAEKLFRFRRGQRRGGFVEDQEFEVGDERPGDFDKLKFGDGKLGDKRMRVDGDANSGKRFARPRDDGLAIDDAKRRHRGRAHADVLRDVEVRKQLRVLVDRGDARAARIDRRLEAGGLAVQFETP